MSHTYAKLLPNAKDDVNSASQSLPLYLSRPSAGFPMPGEDEVDSYLNINEYLIDHPEATFFVRVSGESMEDLGIYHADVLVVDRSLDTYSGAIVVAAVNGELVVKQLLQVGQVWQLVSAKDGYDPVEVSEGDDCFIWGVVVASVRRFIS